MSRDEREQLGRPVVDPIVVPLIAIQLVAIGLVLLDFLLLAFVVLHRMIESLQTSRRLPELAAARRSMLAAIASIQPADGEQIPRLKGSASHRMSMLAASQLLTTIKGEAQSALVKYLLLAEYDNWAVSLLRSRNGLDRGVACELLGALGCAEFAPELSRLVDDPDPDVRNTAVRALGRLRNPSAIPCLLSSLQCSNGVPPALVGAALLRIGAAGAPALRDGLSSRDVATRAVCAKVLGLLGDFEASDDLVRVLLDDQTRWSLVEAARALGRVGGLKARAPLMHCAQRQPDPEVRIAAIGALSAIIDHDAERMLICLMYDENPHVARAAASALEKSGPRGRDALSCVHAETRAGAYAAEVIAVGQLDRSRRVGSST